MHFGSCAITIIAQICRRFMIFLGLLMLLTWIKIAFPSILSKFSIFDHHDVCIPFCLNLLCHLLAHPVSMVQYHQGGGNARCEMLSLPECTRMQLQAITSSPDGRPSACMAHGPRSSLSHIHASAVLSMSLVKQGPILKCLQRNHRQLSNLE